MFYVVSMYDEYKFKPVFYRGENAVYKFLNDILKVADKISYLLNQNQEMIRTKNDEFNFMKSTICHICDEPLEGDKVRDHCHITGRYLGPAHNACNLNRKDSRIKIPVFFS